MQQKHGFGISGRELDPPWPPGSLMTNQAGKEFF